MQFHELQKKVIASMKYENPKIMICSGAKRSGKTYVLTFVFLMHISKFKDKAATKRRQREWRRREAMKEASIPTISLRRHFREAIIKNNLLYLEINNGIQQREF